MTTGYILGLSRGHNAGACLLKDGEIVFAIEEERLSRHKYDGSPYACMMKVKDYTDKVDAIVICHTQPIELAGNCEFTGDNVYTAMARKLGLIDRDSDVIYNHPQVHDLSTQHHKSHAACAFYRSGFDEAVAVVVDGAGTSRKGNFGKDSVTLWEVESIIDCSYPNRFKTLYKHWGCRDAVNVSFNSETASGFLGEEGTHAELISGHAGITKVYEAVTGHCGFEAIEAGKTMGLFPYGSPNKNIPEFFNGNSRFPLSNRNLVIPTYPNAAIINHRLYSEIDISNESRDNLSELPQIRDLAYAVQQETQEQVLDLIITASKLSDKKNVVLSGGYGLNCVANYHYLERLQEEGINLFVEPVSNDAGTAIGAALLYYYSIHDEKAEIDSHVYLGPEYNYSKDFIQKKAEDYGATIEDADHKQIVKLLTEKNIVALYQGRSENGPRALGNRSLLFDPRFEDGKDYVNQVKRREYFRPFAGSILEEHADEYFDLKQLDKSPYMMYAVNAKEKTRELVPSIIHVDNSCRIQTVSQDDNTIYYDIIKKFYDETGCPILFNTSFNLGGDPLVETIDDALDTLRNSSIQYLYLPEIGKLITVENWQVV